jgi:DNA-binding XRE family transcriptional regulator
MAEIAHRSRVTNNSIASVEDGTATIMTMEKVINSLGCRLTWEGYPKGDTLGSAMRQVRQRKGLSQADLGQAISVTPRTLITLENHTKGRMRVVNAVLKELRIKPKVFPKNRRLVPTKNGPELDVVYTPRVLAQSVVDHFKPSGTILEPCRGSGHFYDAFPPNTTKLYCEIDEGLDFFDWHEPVDWIISKGPLSAAYRTRSTWRCSRRTFWTASPQLNSPDGLTADDLIKLIATLRPIYGGVQQNDLSETEPELTNIPDPCFTTEMHEWDYPDNVCCQPHCMGIECPELRPRWIRCRRSRRRFCPR